MRCWPTWFCSLIKHKRVTTTLAKASSPVRSVAEKLVTLGKEGHRSCPPSQQYADEVDEQQQIAEDGVVKAKHHDVLHCLFAQVMIDAINLVFASTALTSRFKALAESRSCPKGFSITTRRQHPSFWSESPALPSC